MRAILALVILWSIPLASLASTPDVMTMGDAVKKELFLVVVRPDYPYEARRERKTGSGIFDLRFDYETGQLREVHVVKSTGERLLDGHAIGALKLWKAKPRSIHTIRVPITFTMPRR